MEPLILKATCPVHGVIDFKKRDHNDWAWWCERHGWGETPPKSDDLLVFDGECYYLIWIGDYRRSPDGGDPRTWHNVMEEIDGIMSIRKRV